MTTLKSLLAAATPRPWVAASITTVCPLADAELYLRAVNCIEELVEALEDAKESLEDALQHGDFRNGVTDSTGTIDEGEIKAGEIFGKTLLKIDAVLARVKGE